MRSITINQVVKMIGKTPRVIKSDMLPEGVLGWTKIGNHSKNGPYVEVTCQHDPNVDFSLKVVGVAFNKEDKFHLLKNGNIKVFSLDDGPALIYNPAIRAHI
jgi:hypothetical protein